MASPNNHPIVIVVVFVSLVGILFLSLLACALFFFSNKGKKKTRETDIVHIDEDKHVKGTIISGPFGQPSVAITVEDDLNINQDIIRTESLARGHAAGLHSNSQSAAQHIPATTTTATATTSGV